jgi:sporulation protein YlmC with PRC-barrel domain
MSKSVRFVPTIRLKQYDVANKKGQDMGQVQTFVVDSRWSHLEVSLASPTSGLPYHGAL